ncbi:MAG: response regulator, partial [Gammaproteobacteria bacterium]|nr:response regulator [Gammaproteobacteria bacterium]
MSHEIRTPLNAIYGYLQLLQNNEQNVEKKENIKQAMTSAKYLTTILNDILDVAKVTSGEFTIEKTQFALSDVLESVKSELTILASKKSVTIDMVTKGLTHSQCKGDPVRLKQILLNVGSNAIKFSTKGTVTIEVSTHKLKPQLLCIKVVDSGIGMTDVGLSNLFKPFKQADNSTSRKFGGTGLGMAITLNIIKKMKGKIKVKSQVGKGTRIFIRLPLEKIAVKKKSTVKKLTSIPQLKGKSILVAEDNMVNMAIIKSMLSPTQASLTFAKNGQEACDIQNTKAFDMLLMDIQMPIMDGVTACKLIRGRTSDLPIIAVTANVMPHDVDEYLKAGFTNHIAKPIEQDKLNQLLSEYLLQDMAETPLGETKQ